MLIKNYDYFLMALLKSGMLSPIGLLSILLFIAAVGSLIWFKPSHPKLRAPAFWGLLLVSISCQVVAFYTAVYEFDEHPETLVFAALPEGEPDCGTAWTNWLRAGYGISNPCPRGCYRGLVLRKQLAMNGFPPWPTYKRELQCWRRDEQTGKVPGLMSQAHTQ